MKEAFTTVNFQQKSLAQLAEINQIISAYQAQNLRLTLRQLYYQLVTRNAIPNTERSYKNLGKLVSQGRLAGYIDWSAIEDRLRAPNMVTERASPASIMGAVISQYTLPRWAEQDEYVEVWCEKDALAGVLLPITRELHVTLMVNRGYSSQSAMKESAERLEAANEADKHIHIVYVGDQDPSGEDMVRDVYERLHLLSREPFRIEVDKIAITQGQVALYSPPPNPTKMTDSRASGYVGKFGTSSYEADALPPDVLAQVVRDSIEQHMDFDAWDQVIADEDRDKELLRRASAEIMTLRDEE